jgi:hypothetical protein
LRDELGAAADRLSCPDLGRAAMIHAEDAIAVARRAVSELARESREARRAAVAERARKAPVKMFPLVLVLPAFSSHRNPGPRDHAAVDPLERR